MGKANVDALAETHKATMIKCPSFALWCRRHLGKTERMDDFLAAYKKANPEGMAEIPAAPKKAKKAKKNDKADS